MILSIRAVLESDFIPAYIASPGDNEKEFFSGPGFFLMV